MSMAGRSEIVADPRCGHRVQRLHAGWFDPQILDMIAFPKTTTDNA
jgi:hypothetical protein